ncbi:hypothetical protein HY478_00400 [Candidatus Uhrbacteria bacterium]|nr:hypothetical protein [Candidatus Uhrbacteria bacterium]
MKYISPFIASLLALTLIGAGCARSAPPAPVAPTPPPSSAPAPALQQSAAEPDYCTLLSVAEVEAVTGLDISRSFSAEGGCAFVTVPASGFGAGTEQRVLWLGPGPLDLEGAKAAHRSVYASFSGITQLKKMWVGLVIERFFSLHHTSLSGSLVPVAMHLSPHMMGKPPQFVRS